MTDLSPAVEQALADLFRKGILNEEMQSYGIDNFIGLVRDQMDQNETRRLQEEE